MKKYLFIIAFLLIPIFSLAFGANQTTDSTPTRDEVNMLIGLMDTGETLTFAGDATWDNTTLTISKAITIVGAGHTLTGSGALANGLFYISNLTSDVLMRITGFNFVLSGTTQQYAIKISETNVTLTQLRIDNNTFREGNCQLEVAGSFGVVDHNTFYNSCNVSFSFTGGTRATTSWADLSAGTANALFVEDNEWIFEAATGCSSLGIPVDTFNGGKLVFRYNTIDTTANSIDSAIWMFMTHGSAAGGVANGYWQIGTGARRGQSVVEVYNNTVNATGKPLGRLVCLRGGANLIHHNTLIGTGSADIYLREEEYYEPQWSPLRTAWPAEDQIHNTFFWENTSNGTPMESTSFLNNDNFNTLCTGSGSPFSCCTGSGTGTCNSTEVNGLIKLNRDFFLHAPCASGDSVDAFGNTCTHGIETFTSANGAAGTNPTDGDTYPTEGTMQFATTGDNAYYGYVPYTYPHPLQDLTAPTISSFIVDPSGAFIIMTGSETLLVTISTGLTLTSDGGAVTLTYASGSGTTGLVYSTSRTILSTETITYDYTQPGNGIEDASGNDLASISDGVVTNSSTQSGAVTSQTVYGVTGSTVFSGAGSTIYQ